MRMDPTGSGSTSLDYIVTLLGRGARVHTTNMGDDTPLHLAAAHGHLEVVQLVNLSVVCLSVSRPICPERLTQ